MKSNLMMSVDCHPYVCSMRIGDQAVKSIMRTSHPIAIRPSEQMKCVLFSPQAC
jgi:hypothetical protein